MEGAATTWLAWRWWRSSLSPQDHIHILTISNSLWTKFMKWRLVYFVQGFIHSLWWLRSPEIITRNFVLVPLAHAIISMLDLAPLFIPLVHARPFICNQNKCIQIRQHHILMNISIVTKKRKYLVIQLACTSSSNWPSMYSSRGCGCNNGIDVLIRILAPH